MTEMIKETFSVKSNPNTGLRLVKKTKDTLIKNRQSNEKGNVGGGGAVWSNSRITIMSVTSFLKYIDKLHPKKKRLW